MLKDKELTRNVFDLFEQVRRQASMYNEAFDRLSYNSTVFDKLVKELSKFEEGAKDFYEELRKKIEVEIQIVKDEKKNLVRDIAGVSSINELADQFERVTTEKTNIFNNMINSAEQGNNRIFQYTKDIRTILNDYEIELKNFKNRADEVLKEKSDEFLQELDNLIEKKYKATEAILTHRHHTFEHKLANHYETLEYEFYNSQQKMIALNEDIYHRISILDSLLNNRINNEENFKLAINKTIDLYSDKMQELLIRTEPLIEIEPEELKKVIEEIKGPDIIRKHSLNSLLEKKISEVEAKIVTMNKKNNIGLVVAILALLAIFSLVITNSLG